MKINKITTLTTLAILASSEAYSHGYTESPASRALLCKEDKNKDCGSRAQYEPQSIEQIDGQFNSKALDNNMGSAKVSGFEALDEQGQSRWAKTTVKPGQPLKIKWQFTANHKSKHFKFYITKPDWNPDKPLTRSSFEDQPLNCYNPQPAWVAPNQPPKDGLTFTCTMPNRSGYQIIMAEWDVYDTAASFYNLIDLDFTNDKPAGTVILPGGGSEDGESGIQQYDPNKTYSDQGTEVIYNGKIYKNKWWVSGTAPGGSGAWEYIKDYEGNNPTDPSDQFPVEATKFTINPANVKTDDKIYLEVSKDGDLDKILLTEIPENISSSDLLILLAKKINTISSQQLNDQIIAGEKNANGKVVPNGDTLYVYQTSDSPYNISFYHEIADHNSTNELHLMDFKNKYTLDANNNLHLNGKIMSHSSDTVKVAVTLQKGNKQVYRKSGIEIDPMDTYNFKAQIDNLTSGDYKLIVSSELAGAEVWQKTFDVKIQKNEPAPDPEPTPGIESWDSSATYTEGDRVKHNGNLYEAKWWSRGQNPKHSGEWGVWKQI